MNKKQVDKFYAIAGTSLIGGSGLAYTAWHVSNLTQVVMVAGTVAPDGAIESTQVAIEGVPYVLATVPAVMGVKILVGGILVVSVIVLSYYVYKWILMKREATRKGVTMDDINRQNKRREPVVA